MAQESHEYIEVQGQHMTQLSKNDETNEVNTCAVLVMDSFPSSQSEHSASRYTRSGRRFGLGMQPSKIFGSDFNLPVQGSTSTAAL